MHSEGKSRTPKPVDQNVKPETSAARPGAMGAEKTRAPGTRKQDWIAQHLQRVYDDALNDDIPQAMLDLLKALDDEPEQGNRG
jgi:hypothetical protein